MCNCLLSPRNIVYFSGCIGVGGCVGVGLEGYPNVPSSVHTVAVSPVERIREKSCKLQLEYKHQIWHDGSRYHTYEIWSTGHLKIQDGGHFEGGRQINLPKVFSP